ncbi:MAG: DUF2029 domain-containing protein [Clostridia bacterium]|nr:DUF2029 domain-containing protein [Clostridia bacterium]MBQ4131493.1 DUF2029 domain-containing protein [Clostridia bacterium]MBQ9919535.1 DUF2029 domain-containing protein [Clostridia bacterium]
MQLTVNKSVADKKIFDVFFIMLIFGAVLRFAIGVGYYNPQDTLWYKAWAMELQGGLFDIYLKADQISLDYPPIYLFFLKITGAIYKITGEEVHNYTEMFIMKLWPILGDILCSVAIFKVLKPKSPKAAIAASALWIFNPSVIFNCAFWGQTDSIMCLLLLVSFVTLENKKPVLASVLFAIAGMTKYQCLFFTPLFLAELFVKFKFSKAWLGICGAAATVAAVFLPFMIGSKKPLLFFDVYLKGQGTYPYCTLNAYNVYGIFGLNWEEDTLGTPSLYALSFVLIAVLIGFMIFCYIYAKRPSVWVLGFVFMNTLFMFMTRMHERYQFVVLIFILMAAIQHKHRGFFYSFVGMSLITFVNQAVPMFSWRSDNSFFDRNYGELMVTFSILNLALYFVTTYISVKFILKNKATSRVAEGEATA